MNRKRLLIASLVLLLVFQTACKSFSDELRVTLLAAPPLIAVLPLSAELKRKITDDFTGDQGMGVKTADLSQCLSAANGNPAKLSCVQTYQSAIEVIIAHGNFIEANNAKLNKILDLLRGIIASARIYYDGGNPAIRASSRTPVTEASIKAQIKQLKAEMKVE